MRIFIGLLEVSGRSGALKRGFEDLGHRATFINLSPHPFQYGNDDPLFMARVIRRLTVFRQGTAPRILRPLLVLPEFFSRLALFLQILVSHDLFIYCSASSFFRYWDYRALSFLAYWDYRLIRFFGKTLICQFHGSDSRPPYLNGAYVSQPDFSMEKCARDTVAQKKRLRAVGAWASAIIDIPPQGYFHERPYYLSLYVGLPSPPLDAARPAPTCASTESSSMKPVRVLHAPSRPRYKGTAQIREMIERLRCKGLLIEFTELQDKPNQEVVREIRKADLIVDQLYCDYAPSALAAEAMWCGKPVLCGGHSANLWAQLLPPEFLAPVVYCHPREFEPRLEQLLADAALRLKLGAEGYDYVRRLHDPKVVAGNYLSVAAGKAPPEWLYDPRQMKEVWGGFFMAEDRARLVAREMISEFGRPSLALSDKPHLEKEITHWALME